MGLQCAGAATPEFVNQLAYELSLCKRLMRVHVLSIYMIECASDKTGSTHACRLRLLLAAHQRNKHLCGTGEPDTSCATMAEMCQEHMHAVSMDSPVAFAPHGVLSCIPVG